jgi:hypothetical protein
VSIPGESAGLGRLGERGIVEAESPAACSYQGDMRANGGGVDMGMRRRGVRRGLGAIEADKLYRAKYSR